MQPYVFETFSSFPGIPEAQKELGPKKDIKKDPFMLFAIPHQPRTLFTQQDMEQSYKTGYIEAKSASLKELQEEAEFQKIEALKMITDYFPQFIQQNQENCKIFCKNILDISQKIIAKLLPQDKTENACQSIIHAFKTLIDPLCQQDHLRISLHPLMQEKVETVIKEIFEEKGTSIPVEFLPRQDLKISECQVRWPEGMLVIDQTALENNLQQLLTMESIGDAIAEVILKESRPKNT